MKNLLQKALLLSVLAVVALPLAAAVDVREFSSEENRERYQQLIGELRCPKCQNQNLEGSDAPIALDLRRELHRLLEEDRSDAEIKAFMVERYGDYVLYRPPLQDNTLILWWGPPAIFGFGVLVVIAIIWRRRRMLRHDAEQVLSDEDQARFDQLLRHENEDTRGNSGSAS